MAIRLRYTGDAVLSLEEVCQQCRIDADSPDAGLIQSIIIPGVTAQCEARTGAAVRQATYQEDWPASRASGSALDVGQVQEVATVEVFDATAGDFVARTATTFLQRTRREAFLHFPEGRPAGVLRITYSAGTDLAAHPGVKNWLLLQAGTAYALRESVITGTIVGQLPVSFMDSFLDDITLPPRF